MKSNRSMRKQWIIAVAATLTCAAPAMANYACSGPVNGVTVGVAGTVAAASAGGQIWGYFCELGTTTNGIGPEACKGILAVLLAAQASGKHVQMWFSDNHDCTWRANNGSWAYLQDWYWGPTMIN
jgi:hypothetical protein